MPTFLPNLRLMRPLSLVISVKECMFYNIPELIMKRETNCKTCLKTKRQFCEIAVMSDKSDDCRKREI